ALRAAALRARRDRSRGAAAPPASTAAGAGRDPHPPRRRRPTRRPPRDREPRARRPGALLPRVARPQSRDPFHVEEDDVKLSFSTLGCPARPLPAVIDAAGRLGYDGVELRFLEGDDALWARPELTGAGLRESTSRLRDAGLAISCVDTRSFFHHPEAAAREAAIEVGEAPAEGLAVLGDHVRHVHLKDVARQATPQGRGWVPRLPGHGEFAPERVLSALRARGYDRWVSFEWEKRWYPALEEPEVALPHFVRWAAREMRDVTERETTARTVARGRLAIEVHPDRASMGHAAADVVSAHLRREVARDGRTAAIFASAPS